MFSAFPPWLFAILFLIGAGVVALFVKPVVMIFLKPVLKKAERQRMANRAASQRSNKGAQPQQQVRVRQTDIEEDMSREDKAKRDHAEKLVKQGQIVEAARLFEDIKFQRRAIDLLEQNGHIDEAVAVLLRLNTPMRAGVVYERNGMPEKAGHYFMIANQPEKAGDAYLKAAEKDYRQYQAAGDCFKQAGKIERSIAAYAKVLQTGDVVDTCVTLERYNELLDYARDPVNALNVFRQLSDEQLKTFIDKINLTPEAAQTFANWSRTIPTELVDLSVLERLQSSEELATHFWRASTPAVRKRLVGSLKSQKLNQGVEMVQAHARCLRQLNDLQAACDLYFAIDDDRNVADTILSTGEIGQCHNWLVKRGHQDIAAGLAPILKEQAQGPWSRNQLESARQMLERIPERQPDRATEVADSPPPEDAKFKLAEVKKAS